LSFVTSHLPGNTPQGFATGDLRGTSPHGRHPTYPAKSPKMQKLPRCTPATSVGSRGPERRGVDLQACVHISPTRRGTSGLASMPSTRQGPPPGATQLCYRAERIPPTRQSTRASHPPEASGPLHGQSAHLTYPARTPRPPHGPEAICPPTHPRPLHPSPSASPQSSYPANPGAETIGTPFNTRG
jgi:hypothetical protein